MILVDLGWTGISAQGADTGYGMVDSHPELKVKQLKQVRKTPGWPRSWVDFSLPISTILTGVYGTTCTFWADLTPFSPWRFGPLECP